MKQDPRKGPQQQPGPKVSTLRPGRFILTFAILVLVQSAFLVAPFMRPSVERFSQALSQASAVLIQQCGGHAVANAAVLRSTINGFAIEMKDGCNGVGVMILLWSGLLAFPASWKAKIVGLLVSTFAVQSVNFLRFISLFYLGQYSMKWFNFAHEYLWESLIMLDAMVVFGIWVKQSMPTSPAQNVAK